MLSRKKQALQFPLPAAEEGNLDGLTPLPSTGLKGKAGFLPFSWVETVCWQGGSSRGPPEPAEPSLQVKNGDPTKNIDYA